MKRMEDQAHRFGLQIIEAGETLVTENNSGFTVVTDRKPYDAKSLIVATGAAPRSLGIKGEKELRGRGVSYCATRYAAFFTDEVITVVGGGDAALKEAVYLTRFASKVFLINRRDQFRAEPVLVDDAAENANIEFVFDHVLTEVNGTEIVESITVQNVKKGI